MKKMLIIGSSSGIGKAIFEHFNNLNYEIITLSRSGNPTIKGDITDKIVRLKLYDTIVPDILIYSAGVFTKNLSKMYETNTIAAVELINHYYDNMKDGGEIITISSIAATMSENLFSPNIPELNAYASSKKALSDFCLNLSKNRQKNVRISTIEPNEVCPTNIHKTKKIIVDEKNYTNFNFNNFTPIQPSYIAQICEWILMQPNWVNISKIVIENNFKKN